MSTSDKLPSHFIQFQSSVEAITLPKRFTFPFYYQPHELSKRASTELQEYLTYQNDFEHNFGLEEGQDGIIIGKMFGVLVVQAASGIIGYLAAFSGKLADSNQHPHFVPPIYDMLNPEGYYRKGEEYLNQLNAKIDALERLPELEASKALLQQEEDMAEFCLSRSRKEMKLAKKQRKARREIGTKELLPEEFEQLKKALIKESHGDQYHYKRLQNYWRLRLEDKREKLAFWTHQIKALKEERKQQSNQLQQRLFQEYQFLNQAGETRDLQDIFKDTLLAKPPAGAGECAAPKLLQYAFKNQLKPIALAEFWWGASPKAQLRKHRYFYPACRGKCEPILGHMLQGIEMDENPLLQNPALNKELEIIYEDEQLLLINKPAEFLSVPGKNIRDSVQLRMQKRYPNATGPLIVHRLDMSTSGLMLIAKSKEIHQALQLQFIKRTISKRYTALLDGTVNGEEGIIDLPLRVDLDNRPQQLVCFEHGKSATTRWKVVDRSSNQTRIHFFPITGRTHQLRVHAAHVDGLNCPISGDDLYGIPKNRLYLHAEYLRFQHPVSKEILEIECPADF